ncbi:beta-defensin 29 [Rattus norvegicus]|uniref:Beta-defensin 29 n=2 Tax=Rattus norvegicus TaxID=10116 RepID=DFB29_RAT|nr:beta-defensin 29 precursor [Rattus norvegicus]Q32ZG3.1 RecName: Full=Beta-defensin 29; Short=BD-29; AltName: Full=Defensin, beta 29; Flags: Precursor [Rattus norvegicus]AAT51899.1 beta-defensin 29 [Rattus norvegicus]EDL86064.1 beta-defensin 29 [Rattus norvegicus]|eukprot:NP_001032445.1 beta-defensin 29 precursor [Rattus norvegicus]
MPVTKPYFVTVAVLLILVDKTTGGLFGLRSGKRREPWVSCELYQGSCRNACQKYEIQYLTCPKKRKCCLKFPMKITRV